MNESETVQKANAYKLEEDTEDAMDEELDEKMLSEAETFKQVKRASRRRRPNKCTRKRKHSGS